MPVIVITTTSSTSVYPSNLVPCATVSCRARHLSSPSGNPSVMVADEINSRRLPPLPAVATPAASRAIADVQLAGVGAQWVHTPLFGRPRRNVKSQPDAHCGVRNAAGTESG